MHDIIVSEPYIDNRQRYTNDILTYLTLIFNIDIAIHIYKYYDQIYKDNLNYHIYKYKILKPSSLLVDDIIYLIECLIIEYNIIIIINIYIQKEQFLK